MVNWYTANCKGIQLIVGTLSRTVTLHHDVWVDSPVQWDYLDTGVVRHPLHEWEILLEPYQWLQNWYSTGCPGLRLMLLLLLCSQPYLWGSQFWVRFICMWPVFNPTIEVVTFHLHGYLVVQGQFWDWLVWCQQTVTGWGCKSDLQLLSQWAACKSKKIHSWDTH